MCVSGIASVFQTVNTTEIRQCVKCAHLGVNKIYIYAHQIRKQFSRCCFFFYISQFLTLHPVHNLARCPLAYRFHDQSHPSGSFCSQCQTKAQRERLGSLRCAILCLLNLRSDHCILIVCLVLHWWCVPAEYLEESEEAQWSPDHPLRVGVCVCVCVSVSAHSSSLVRFTESKYWLDFSWALLLVECSLHSPSSPSRTRWAKLRQHRVGGCGQERPSAVVNSAPPVFPALLWISRIACLVMSYGRTKRITHIIQL